MKKYAVEVFYNQEFEQYVRELWRKCDENQFSSYMNRVVGTKPHTALAVYDGVDPERLREQFAGFIRQDLQPIPIRFDAVACFPATKVTFLQPNTGKALTDLMMNLHDHFLRFENQCNMFYKPDHWFPHVTIGLNNSMEEALKTLGFIMENFTPQTAVIDRLALVEIENIDNVVTYRDLMVKRMDGKSE